MRSCQPMSWVQLKILYVFTLKCIECSETKFNGKLSKLHVKYLSKVASPWRFYTVKISKISVQYVHNYDHKVHLVLFSKIRTVYVSFDMHELVISYLNKNRKLHSHLKYCIIREWAVAIISKYLKRLQLYEDSGKIMKYLKPKTTSCANNKVQY